MAKATKRAANHRPPQEQIDAVLAKIDHDDDAAMLSAALAEKRSIEAERNRQRSIQYELRESRKSMRDYSSDSTPEARLGWARELVRYVNAVRAVERESLLRGWCELLKDHKHPGPKRGSRMLLMAMDGKPEADIASYIGECCELPGMGEIQGSDFRAGMDYVARNVQEQMPVAPEHFADAHLWFRGDDEWYNREPVLPENSEGNRAGEQSDLPILSKPAAAIYELLCELPEYRALTAPEITTELNRRDPKLLLDESAVRGRYADELKAYGLENAPRKGYRIQPSRRPAE